MFEQFSIINLPPVFPCGHRSAERALTDLHDHKYRISYAAEDLIRKGKFYDDSPAFSGDPSIVLFPVVYIARRSQSLTLRDVDAMASGIGYKPPTVEQAVRLREQVSDTDILALGLKRFLVMHPGVTNPDRTKNLLGLGIETGGMWLHAYSAEPSSVPKSETGFIYLDPVQRANFED